MVDFVNSLNGLNRPVSAGKAPATDSSKADDTEASAATASSEPIVQISGNATALSSLYEAANAFVQKSSVKPLTGSSSDVEMSYILNIEKYNNHVFDQAADSLVGEAGKIGVTLNKDDVIGQLKEANSTIASYKTDLENQQHNLSDNYMSKYLSQSDIDQITDYYIKAKDSGVPDIVTIAYASNLGMAKHDQALGIKYLSGDQYLVTDEASPPAGIADSVAEAAKKLYGHFGLSNLAVNMLAASYSGPDDSSGRSQAFQFLLKMLEMDTGSKGSSLNG